MTAILAIPSTLSPPSTFPPHSTVTLPLIYSIDSSSLLGSKLLRLGASATALTQELNTPRPSEPSDWQIGMAVWMYTPPSTSALISAKFRKGWIGPCRIIFICSHDLRDLIDPQQQRQFRIHVNRLKPFYDRIGATPEPTGVTIVDPASIPLLE
ncbi:hypothetical protein BGZ47_008912 [Haplosporangium gracile]|nr:hypothetical protein BGZ47_008912 [Haplosporangium gracile]